jgi:hypothetical protein
MAAKPSTVPKSGLKDLTFEQFENLIFDLVTNLGLQNVSWRTPGADGGRDIEADEIGPDFSGFHVSKRWFIECKKYSGSVDWPTIYGKIAYADSLGAHYLLMCTSSKFTPAATTQVAHWNSQRRDLQIRLWPSHELELQLRAHPDIRAKYGLPGALGTPGTTLVSLSLAMSKSVASHHATLVFQGLSIDPMLEAAQSLADLLTQRMGDIEHGGRIQPIMRQLQSDSHWTSKGCPFKADTFAMRAFLNYLAALTQSSFAVDGKSDFACEVPLSAPMFRALTRYKGVFDAICLWGDLEYRFDSTTLRIAQRTSLI